MAISSNSMGIFLADGGGVGIRNHPQFSVTDSGVEIAIDSLNLPDSRKKSRQILIVNDSVNPVRVAFDKNGADIVFSDAPFLSWQLTLLGTDSVTGAYAFSGYIECEKIAFRTDFGKTANIYLVIL